MIRFGNFDGGKFNLIFRLVGIAHQHPISEGLQSRKGTRNLPGEAAINAVFIVSTTILGIGNGNAAIVKAKAIYVCIIHLSGEGCTIKYFKLLNIQEAIRGIDIADINVVGARWQVGEDWRILPGNAIQTVLISPRTAGSIRYGNVAVIGSGITGGGMGHRGSKYIRFGNGDGAQLNDAIHSIRIAHFNQIITRRQGREIKFGLPVTTIDAVFIIPGPTGRINNADAAIGCTKAIYVYLRKRGHQ